MNLAKARNSSVLSLKPGTGGHNFDPGSALMQEANRFLHVLKDAPQLR